MNAFDRLILSVSHEPTEWYDALMNYGDPATADTELRASIRRSPLMQRSFTHGALRAKLQKLDQWARTPALYQQLDNDGRQQLMFELSVIVPVLQVFDEEHNR